MRPDVREKGPHGPRVQRYAGHTRVLRIPVRLPWAQSRRRGPAGAPRRGTGRHQAGNRAELPRYTRAGRRHRPASPPAPETRCPRPRGPCLPVGSSRERRAVVCGPPAASAAWSGTPAEADRCTLRVRRSGCGRPSNLSWYRRLHPRRGPNRPLWPPTARRNQGRRKVRGPGSRSLGLRGPVCRRASPVEGPAGARPGRVRRDERLRYSAGRRACTPSRDGGRVLLKGRAAGGCRAPAPDAAWPRGKPVVGRVRMHTCSQSARGAPPRTRERGRRTHPGSCAQTDAPRAAGRRGVSVDACEAPRSAPATREHMPVHGPAADWPVGGVRAGPVRGGAGTTPRGRRPRSRRFGSVGSGCASGRKAAGAAWPRDSGSSSAQFRAAPTGSVHPQVSRGDLRPLVVSDRGRRRSTTGALVVGQDRG